MSWVPDKGEKQYTVNIYKTEVEYWPSVSDSRGRLLPPEVRKEGEVDMGTIPCRDREEAEEIARLLHAPPWRHARVCEG